ncbi:late embryogenesis abundant protein [Musa troglodytarum]|uniref:Late embryogenesis abundant protein n=1 Tax=Musa troglodytarum TaxID=320322 RepID=A0A9E7JX55_9LILI|nr:late embryogenesis abundant protein [Musa troglodytarum]
MSQKQQRRPDHQPIRYGDVFPVAGELAGQTIAPGDAAMMHAAENKALGVTPKGGPASVMESAAMRNEQRGIIGHNQFSPTPANQGASVTQTEIPGCTGQRLVTEFVAGQVGADHRIYVKAFQRAYLIMLGDRLWVSMWSTLEREMAAQQAAAKVGKGDKDSVDYRHGRAR